MKIVYTDVLVIGGGLAGLRIAIGAKRRGHDVIILSLVPPKRSQKKKRNSHPIATPLAIRSKASFPFVISICYASEKRFRLRHAVCFNNFSRAGAVILAILTLNRFNK